MADNKNLNEEISRIVKKVLNEKAEFSNVARPKPEKASTSASSTWKTDDAPKPSASTQGSWDSTNTPGGVSATAKKVWTVKDIAMAATKILQENAAFSNKPLPKPTTVSASTQPAWKTEEEAPIKPSASTQAGWDNRNTPGAVSEEAKQVWTVKDIAMAVTKVLQENAAFSNKPLPKPTTVSASTQPSWKSDEEKYGKLSASTQAVWKKDEPRRPSASTQAGWK